MDPQIGESLTRWTIRLAIACYVGRVLVDIGSRRRVHATASAHQATRWVWTVGCGLYLVHVLAAFAVFHGWSHEAAYRHTAHETAAVIGLDWGGGLYFNYAFTVFWIADTLAWWLDGAALPYRSRAYFWTVHGVFAFMVVNATVVFGPPVWKWVAVAVGLVIAAAWLFQNDE